MIHGTSSRDTCSGESLLVYSSVLLVIDGSGELSPQAILVHRQLALLFNGNMHLSNILSGLKLYSAFTSTLHLHVLHV